MTEKSTSGDIDLETFLQAAGQSFSDAQKSLLPGMDVNVNMLLNNAELELKVAVTADKFGKMTIHPVSVADITEGGIDPGMLSTIKINFISSIGSISQIPDAVDVPANTRTVVPSLTGLTLEDAAALLKAQGWTFQPHAADAGEIASSGEENRGKVLRQDPPAAGTADKSSTTVHFWTDLGNIPVKEIDGIGTKGSDILSKTGIKSVGELSLADVSSISGLLHINETRARSLVDMAALMSRLVVMGFKDEIVEVIVKGGGIRSIQELAGAEPEELYRTCRSAVDSGKVQVPKDFDFTAGDVQKWITAARG